MQFFATVAVSALFALVAHAVPAPVPQEACNPNPHGRSCTAVLIGAAGVESTISFPIDYQVHPTGTHPSHISVPRPY